MAREVIEIATVFNGDVENRVFRADRATVNAPSGDVLSVQFTDGSDDHGRVLGVLFTPNAAVVRRPLDEGGRP